MFLMETKLNGSYMCLYMVMAVLNLNLNLNLNSLLVTRQMTSFHPGGGEISPLNVRVKRTKICWKATSLHKKILLLRCTSHSVMTILDGPYNATGHCKTRRSLLTSKETCTRYIP